MWQIVKEWHDAISAIRDLKKKYRAAQDPEGPAGKEWTPEEREEVLTALAHAVQETGELIGASADLLFLAVSAIKNLR